MESSGHQVTGTDKRPILSVVHWIMMVIMCISAITKLGTKWVLIRNLQLDDAFTVAAMVRAILNLKKLT